MCADEHEHAVHVFRYSVYLVPRRQHGESCWPVDYSLESVNVYDKILRSNYKCTNNQDIEITDGQFFGHIDTNSVSTWKLKEWKKVKRKKNIEKKEKKRDLVFFK